jgi:hypothetical protein
MMPNQISKAKVFDNAIVVFVDILGYRDLVERVATKPELVKEMENLFYGIVVDAMRKLSQLELEDITGEPDPEIQEYYSKVVSSIRVRCISDSFIFTLPVSAVNFRCKLYDEKTTVGNCIETLFSAMVMLSTLFISKMGYILRGGISYGNHYESERDRQFFIFSEAFNRAVQLEKGVAKAPRIVMDEHVLQYLREIGYPNIDKYFYKDGEDGYFCLDIYKSLRIFRNAQNVLHHIKQGITLAIQNNANKPDVLAKLKHFAQYHNRWVTGAKMNQPHLAIDLNKT